ncbi:hypothetical protein GF415_03220 [Candidatus Micrarchaeota archaeon]|nr:hypothetical protein [Candidatus Micrarchaeota archaeon]
MAQKKKREVEGPPEPVQKAETPKKLGTVPVKVEKNWFVEHIEAELFRAGFSSAGDVVGGELRLTEMGPVFLGIRGGAILHQMMGEMPFLGGRLGVEKATEDWDFYSTINFTAFRGRELAKGSELRIYSDAGVVWEPIGPEEANGFSMKLGAEMNLDIDTGLWGAYLEPLKAGFGTSASYGKITVYAIEEVLAGGKKPGSAKMEVLAPHHKKTKAGVIMDLHPTEIELMGFFSKLEKGGEFIIRSESEHFAPEVYVKGAKRDAMLPDELTVGMRFRFGGKHKQFAVEGEQTFDEELGEGRARIIDLEGEGDYQQAAENFASALRDSETFDEFASKYENLSTYDLLYAVYKLGRKALEGADTETAKKMDEGGAFADTTEKLSKLSTDDVYGALREYIETGEMGGVGAGTCANISILQAELLRRGGLEANPLGIAYSGQGHVVVTAFDPKTKKSYLMNWSDIYERDGRNIWPLIQKLSKERGTLIGWIDIYDKNNNLVGRYEGPEGKMTRKAAGAEETSGKLRDRLSK